MLKIYVKAAQAFLKRLAGKGRAATARVHSAGSLVIP